MNNTSKISTKILKNMEAKNILKGLISELIPCTIPLQEKNYLPTIQINQVWDSVFQLITKDQKQFFTALPFLIEYNKLN